MEREISKTPDTPKYISLALRHLLTELCFEGSPLIAPVDLLFVYGTPFFINEAAQHITILLDQKLANKVLIAGGMMPHGEPLIQQKSEAKIIYEALDKNKFKHINFFLEEESQNSLANVTNALKILDFRNYSNIGFVFLSHCARRGYLTLKKFCPNAHIFQSPYHACCGDAFNKLSKDTWHTFPEGIKRVWGEYLRIKLYGQRGDIKYSEINQLVEQIDIASQKLNCK